MVDLLYPVLLGLTFGWLVNYLADVLPETRRFSKPACPHCRHVYTLNAYLLGRKCPQCGQGRGIRFWAVMVVMIAANLYIWQHPPARLGFVLGSVLLAYFALVIVIDMEHRLILHSTSIVGGLFGLGLGWLSHGFLPTILGGIGGFVIMFVLYYLGVLFSRLRARRLRSTGQVVDDEEALGFGDVALAGVLGLVMGWPLIWFGLLVGILLAGFFGVILILFLVITRRYQTRALMVFIPYGPFLVLSAFLIVFLPTWLATVVPM